MRLSAVMIVRDEARCLARCLGSIEDLVDEIVVVDTGSTDDTVAIAERFGAIVAHRRWDDDFSAPRNLSLDIATGDWVLYIDADEHVVSGDRTLLEAARRAQPDALALRLLLRSNRGHTPYRELRLWQHRSDIRFRGRIHEQVVVDIDRLVEAGGGVVGAVDLLVEHDGYEGDQAAKNRRNLPILLQELAGDPERVFLWLHLGTIRADSGDLDGALEAWGRGAAASARLGSKATISVCHQRLIAAAAARGEPFADLVAEADDLFPGDAAIDWAVMCAAEITGDVVEVERRATRLLDVDRSALEDRGLGVDERMLGEWPLAARARARVAMHRLRDASADLAMAEQLSGGSLEYRVLRHAVERLVERDPGGAPRLPREGGGS